ncbi:MAG TPA: Uma2 family endonuclease [Tepidisphaeraceae bacterium]|nr:Uma2 family endonuclease [Tepidisphaeraceae bacterium]
MTQAAPRQPRIARRGEPVWEIAELFPEQGDWTEGEYLALTTNRLVEFDNGTIEVLPVPTKTHQEIVLFLYRIIFAFIEARGLGGKVLVAAYKLRVPSGKYREPDVLYLTPEQDGRAGEQFTEAAELVVEVVSPDDPNRDYVTKRQEYAEAGVTEYWIVDMAARQVLVLRLEAGTYVEHGKFGPGQRASSQRFHGLSVAVDDVLSQGK